MRKYNSKFILPIILVLVTIGYALVSTQLKLNGSVGIHKKSWKIYWDDPVVTRGSVSSTLPDIVDDVGSKDKLIWEVEFDKPGEFYEFTVYAVNEGQIDAMIKSIDETVSDDLPSYFKYDVTYINGAKPAVGDVLAGGTDSSPNRLQYKVRIYYDDNAVTAEEINSITEHKTYTFSLTIVYDQADNTAYKGYAFGDEVKYNPVSNSVCTSGSNCYTWNVIDVYDSKLNDTITLQMDHNIAEGVDWVSKKDYGNNSAYGTYGRTDKGPITAMKRLETATSSWSNALKLNYTYDTTLATNNYGVMTCVDGVCTVKGNQITTNAKARMITGEEVAALTVAVGAEKNTVAYKWTLASSNETDWYFFSRKNYILGTTTLITDDQESTLQLKWLLSNTNANSYSGATGNTATGGYWTLSPVDGNITYAWSVGASQYEPYNGNIGAYYVYNLAGYGLRPVISVPKSVLNN